MNGRTYGCRIDHNPKTSMMIKLAMSDSNAAEAVSLIIKNMFDNNPIINQYDLPAWILAFELIAESLKTQMNAVGGELYDDLKMLVKMNTISFVPPAES